MREKSARQARERWPLLASCERIAGTR
ncbi:BcsR/BcsP family cellulose biosynthesis protein [Cupriavidus basilensis]